MSEDYKKFNETELSSFQARYGRAIPDNDYPVNEFIENILKRQTVRRFQNKKIDPKLLEKLIAAAQSAPTSSMIQPWSVIAVESQEQKAKLFIGENMMHMGMSSTPSLDGKMPDPTNLSAVMRCSVFLIWLVDCTIMEKVFTDTSLDQTHPELNSLRKIAQESIRYTNFELRCIIDAVIAAQTFTLAAESAGLGTMYCGAIKTIDLTEAFNLPNRVLPLFGICVGYPADNLNAFGQKEKDPTRPKYIKPRLPQNLILHKEVYQEPNFEEVKSYNNLLKLFYELENLDYDWFDRMVRRTQIQKTNRNYRSLLEKFGFRLK